MAHILLLDDKDVDRRHLREFLERDGHDVTEATDSDAGLAVYEHGRHDLVLLDLTLPGHGESEILVKLVSEFPDVKVLVTARGGETISTRGYLEVADRAGTVRTLPKPFTVDHLRRAVRVMLRGGEWSRERP